MGSQPQKFRGSPNNLLDFPGSGATNELNTYLAGFHLDDLRFLISTDEHCRF